MNPIWSSAWAAAKRSLHHERRPPTSRRQPLWQLVVLEVAYLVGLALRPRRLLPALTVAGLVFIGLSPATPGPVLSAPARVALAVPAATVVAWALPHRR